MTLHFALSLYCFEPGALLSSASEGTFLQPSISIFVALMAMCLGREPASPLKILGVFSAVGGSLLIVYASSVVRAEASAAALMTPSPFINATSWNNSSNLIHSNSTQSSSSSSSNSHAWGYFCFFINTFSYAACIIMQKPMLARFPPFTLNFWTFVFGGSINTIVALFFVDRVDWVNISGWTWLGVAYIVVMGTVVAWFIYAIGVKQLSSSVAGMAICLQVQESSAIIFVSVHDQ